MEADSTIQLPLFDKGIDLLDVQLPQYYREGFFSKDTLLHPELSGGRSGIAGDPVPYSIHNDNVITGLLLLCFMLAVVAFSNVRSFITRQLKSFYYLHHAVTTEVTETITEVRFQAFLVMLTCLQLALLFYFYTLHYIGETFILQSQYYLIAIYLMVFIVYFQLKLLLQTMVNMVFFDSKRNGQWIKTQLFITAIEGVLFFPAVLMLAYFDSPIQNVEVYFILSFLTVKFLTIYKCFVIFFRQNVVKMQIILYLCALEMIPLLFLWSLLVLIANSLIINF